MNNFPNKEVKSITLIESVIMGDIKTRSDRNNWKVIA